MKILIPTIGTRGDVQPFIALGVGLKATGHAVTIATLDEFKKDVLAYGLQYDALRGDFLKAAQSAALLLIYVYAGVQLWRRIRQLQQL